MDLASTPMNTDPRDVSPALLDTADSSSALNGNNTPDITGTTMEAIRVAESKRLYLTPLNLSHLEGFMEILNHEKGNMWQVKKENQPDLYTEQSTRDRIIESQPTAEKPWRRRWVIMLKGECRVKQDESELRKITDAGELNNGQVNGQGKEQMEDIMIGSVAIPRKDEIGYKIHPDHWRRGYMDEALKLTIELFWRLPENKNSEFLKAGADPENIPSSRLLEKHGFVKGELKRDYYERWVWVVDDGETSGPSARDGGGGDVREGNGERENGIEREDGSIGVQQSTEEGKLKANKERRDGDSAGMQGMKKTKKMCDMQYWSLARGT